MNITPIDRFAEAPSRRRFMVRGLGSAWLISGAFAAKPADRSMTGCAIHIHLKVHIGGSVNSGHYTGGHVSHTGQLFFPEEISDQVAMLDPYRQHHVTRTLQTEDDVFQSQHGSGFIVALERMNKDSIGGGLVATAVLGVNPEAVPKEVGFGPDGRGGRPGPPPFDHRPE